MHGKSSVPVTPTKADVSELFRLIRFMLKIDPGSRPSAEEVMKHPWYTHGKALTRKASWDDNGHDLTEYRIRTFTVYPEIQTNLY